MRYEEKAMAQFKSTFCAFCEDKNNCADSILDCTLYNSIYKQAYLDGLAEGRKENSENIKKIQEFRKIDQKQILEQMDTIAELEKELAELKAHCKAVDEVNEKMKCCGNCLTYRKIKSGDITLTEHSLLKEEKCYRCDNYNKWELAE